MRRLRTPGLPHGRNAAAPRPERCCPTAGTLLHQRERDKLTGCVQIDEIIIGGNDGSSRRLGERRNYVPTMVEVAGESCGRLRLEAIDDATGDTCCRP